MQPTKKKHKTQKKATTKYKQKCSVGDVVLAKDKIGVVEFVGDVHFGMFIFFSRNKRDKGETGQRKGKGFQFVRNCIAKNWEKQ